MPNHKENGHYTMFAVIVNTICAEPWSGFLSIDRWIDKFHWFHFHRWSMQRKNEIKVWKFYNSNKQWMGLNAYIHTHKNQHGFRMMLWCQTVRMGWPLSFKTIWNHKPQSSCQCGKMQQNQRRNRNKKKIAMTKMSIENPARSNIHVE